MCIIFHNLSSKRNNFLNLWNSNFFFSADIQQGHFEHRSVISNNIIGPLFIVHPKTKIVFLPLWLFFHLLLCWNRYLPPKQTSLILPPVSVPYFSTTSSPPPLTFLSSFSVFPFQPMHHSFLCSWIWETFVCLLHIVENWLILLSSSVLSSLSLCLSSHPVWAFLHSGHLNHTVWI